MLALQVFLPEPLEESKVSNTQLHPQWGKPNRQPTFCDCISYSIPERTDLFHQVLGILFQSCKGSNKQPGLLTDEQMFRLIGTSYTEWITVKWEELG